LEIEPEMKGWIAAIISTWPIGAMERSPMAQSKTS
jgi:hypothetical protein